MFADIEGDKSKTFLDVNSQALKLTGYSKEEILKKNKNDIFINESRDKKTVILKTKENKEIKCLQKTVVVDEGGRVVCFRVLRDLSEIENLKEEKKNQEELLLQKSKMAAMGEMISHIAHQWKQPVNIVSLLIQQIDSIIPDIPQNAGEKLKNIETRVMEQLNYMSETITDFKEFFNPSKQKMHFSPKDAIYEIYGLLKPRFERQKIAVTINEKHSLKINANKNDFKHIVLNIINNAREKLEESEQKEKQVVIEIDKNEKNCILTFKDNGGGIDPKLLPSKLFDPYSTTKGDKGTGIGLSICKMIVENSLKGSIKAENHKKWATFSISIPL